MKSMLPPKFSWYVRFSFAAVLEQLGQDPVDDRGADLALDVVADDRHPGLDEPLRPGLVAGDEHGQAVHERDVGVERGLRVVLGRLLGPHRQVRHHDVGLRVAERLRDVHGWQLGLGDRLAVVPAEAVERRAPLHGHAGGRDLRESDRVVGLGDDGLREVRPDLLGVHVERRDELDVPDVVAAEVDVHQPGTVSVGSASL